MHFNVLQKYKVCTNDQLKSIVFVRTKIYKITSSVSEDCIVVRAYYMQ